jgi:membrane protein involved in colicin uptake
MNTTRKSRRIVILLTLTLALGFVLEAVALVGMPRTAGSVAGVARRTTRHTVEATTAVVATTAAVSSAEKASAAAAQTASAEAAAAAAASASAASAAAASADAAAAQSSAAKTAKPSASKPAVGTIVTSLPSGSESVEKGGVEYYKSGGVYYRAAFQGNNLVYVVQQP